jgi:hypothetical protein
MLFKNKQYKLTRLSSLGFFKDFLFFRSSGEVHLGEGELLEQESRTPKVIQQFSNNISFFF